MISLKMEAASKSVKCHERQLIWNVGQRECLGAAFKCPAAWNLHLISPELALIGIRGRGGRRQITISPFHTWASALWPIVVIFPIPMASECCVCVCRHQRRRLLLWNNCLKFADRFGWTWMTELRQCHLLGMRGKELRLFSWRRRAFLKTRAARFFFAANTPAVLNCKPIF